MIINLLNQQPEDVKQGMKLWLLTQFNSQLSDDPQYYKDFDISKLEHWKESQEFINRRKIIKKKIPKSRIADLKAEIAELKILKQDIKNVDHKNIALSYHLKKAKNSSNNDDASSNTMFGMKQKEQNLKGLGIDYQLENILDDGKMSLSGSHPILKTQPGEEIEKRTLKSNLTQNNTQRNTGLKKNGTLPTGPTPPIMNRIDNLGNPVDELM